MPFAWGAGGGIGLEGNFLGIYPCQKANLMGGGSCAGGALGHILMLQVQGIFLLLGLTRNAEQGQPCISYLHELFPFWEGGRDSDILLVFSRPAPSFLNSFLLFLLSPSLLSMAVNPPRV